MVTTLRPPPKDDHEHSAAEYKNGRRDCDRCRDEWAVAQTVYRRKKGSKPRTKPKHGERAMYNSGCRCPKCRAANRAYAAERRKAQKT